MKAGSMQKGSWKTVDWAGYGVAAFVLVGSAVAYFRPDLLRLEDSPALETYVAPPPQVPGPAVNRWREAAKRVEEDRGQPTGRAARVRVPPQLLHYADKRRFLAIQVAGWREQNYDLPDDDAGLARLIRKGEYVEVKPVTDDYILYGVGANATGEPLFHYDVSSGREITLYPRWDFFDDARAVPARRGRGQEGGRRRQARRAPQDHHEDAGRPAAPRRGQQGDPRRAGRGGRPPAADHERGRGLRQLREAPDARRGVRGPRGAGPGVRPPWLRPRPVRRTPRLPRAPAQLHPPRGAGGDDRHRPPVPRAVRTASRVHVAHPQRALPAPARRDQLQRHEDRGASRTPRASRSTSSTAT